MSERRKIYEDVSGANIRIPFTLKNANTILTICTDQFSNFNIVFYWKVEVKQAKKRAKRASELRLLKQFQFFNTFQQGPTERSVFKFFLSCWLIFS